MVESLFLSFTLLSSGIFESGDFFFNSIKANRLLIEVLVCCF